MTLSIVHLSDPDGMQHTVEVHCADVRSLPGFALIGAGSDRTRELRDRLRAGLVNQGLGWPLRRLTVNVPTGPTLRGDRRRYWAGFDLAIAVGIVRAHHGEGSVGPEHDLWGEVSLSGAIRAEDGGVAPYGIADVVRLVRGIPMTVGAEA